MSTTRERGESWARFKVWNAGAGARPAGFSGSSAIELAKGCGVLCWANVCSEMKPGFVTERV